MAAGLPSVRDTGKDCFNSAQPERQAAAAVLALARHDVPRTRTMYRGSARFKE